MSNEQNVGPTKMETLLGGMELEVEILGGAKEKVKVRQIPLKLLQLYAAAMEDEPLMIQLLCDRPAGWVEDLTNESAEKIVIEGERLNEDFFDRWYGRRRRRQEKLVPGINEMIAAELRSKIQPQSAPVNAVSTPGKPPSIPSRS